MSELLVGRVAKTVTPKKEPKSTDGSQTIVIKMQSDRPDLVVISGQQQKSEKRAFSPLRAVGQFLKGLVIDPLKAMFSVKGLLTAGTLILACSAFPPLIPVLAIVGLGTGVIQGIKGTARAITYLNEGDGKKAEQAFRHIGQSAAAIIPSMNALRASKLKFSIPENKNLKIRLSSIKENFSHYCKEVLNPKGLLSEVTTHIKTFRKELYGKFKEADLKFNLNFLKDFTLNRESIIRALNSFTQITTQSKPETAYAINGVLAAQACKN